MSTPGHTFRAKGIQCYEQHPRTALPGGLCPAAPARRILLTRLRDTRPTPAAEAIDALFAQVAGDM